VARRRKIERINRTTMNKDIKLIWERFRRDDKGSWPEYQPSYPEKLEDVTNMLETIYGSYNTPEEQKEKILDFFNEYKQSGSQDKIREILQRKMVSILRTDPGSEEARKLMNIMTIIGQPKGEGDLPPVF